VSGARGNLVTRSLLAIMLAVGLTSLPAPHAAAAAAAPHDPREVSIEEAAHMLQQRYGSAARVVRTDEIDEGGRRVYVFRLLSVNGRVWIVHIDARTGTEVP
jgi:hypothetical protein